MGSEMCIRDSHSTDYLQKIDDVWIPSKEDMKDNPEVQLEINKGEK